MRFRCGVESLLVTAAHCKINTTHTAVVFVSGVIKPNRPAHSLAVRAILVPVEEEEEEEVARGGEGRGGQGRAVQGRGGEATNLGSY